MFVESPKNSLLSIGSLNQAVAEQLPKNVQEITENELEGGAIQSSNFQTIFERLFGKKNEAKTEDNLNYKEVNFKQDNSETENENEVTNLIEQNQVANFVINNPIINQTNNNIFIEDIENICTHKGEMSDNSIFIGKKEFSKNLNEYNFFPVFYKDNPIINLNNETENIIYPETEKDVFNNVKNNLPFNINNIKEENNFNSSELNILKQSKDYVEIEKLFSNIKIEEPININENVKNYKKINNFFKNENYNYNFYNDIIPITDKYFAYPVKNIDINKELKIDYFVFSDLPKEIDKSPILVGFLAKNKEIDINKENLSIGLDFNNKNSLVGVITKNNDINIDFFNKKLDPLTNNIKNFNSNVFFPIKNYQANIPEYDFYPQEVKFNDFLVNINKKLFKNNKIESEKEIFSELFFDNENLNNKTDKKIDDKFENKINDIVNKFNFNNKNNEDFFSEKNEQKNNFSENFKESEFNELGKSSVENVVVNGIEKGMTSQFSKPIIVANKSDIDFSNPVVSSAFRRAIDVSNQLQVRGGGTAKIQIQDDKMGSVELTINMKKNNSVSMEIKASDIDLKNNLEENYEILKKALDAQEINLTEFKVTDMEKTMHAGMSSSANQNFSNQNSQSQHQGNEGSNQNSSQQSFNQSLFSGGFSSNNNNFFQNNAEKEYIFNTIENKNYVNKNVKNNMEKNSITNIQRGLNGSIKVLA